MQLWEYSDDSAFEAYMTDKAGDITGETQCPGWIPVTESADLEARCSTLASRLALEQQTVQRLVKLLDEAGHDAAKWRTRCYTRLGLASVAGSICGGIGATVAAWWAR